MTTADRDIPLADCDNCRWNHGPFRSVGDLGQKGHCYMFRKKPGLRCAQFAGGAAGVERCQPKEVR